jgi:hypothetical protein
MLLCAMCDWTWDKYDLSYPVSLFLLLFMTIIIFFYIFFLIMMMRKKKT